MSERASTGQSPYRVQVLDRALAILELLWKQGPELSQAELIERLGLNKSTVRRLLKVLERHRLIEKSPSNGKYRLGLKLFEMGSSAISHLDVRERARSHLEQLVLETGETAHFCILDRGEVLYLDKHEPPRTMRVPSTVGKRNPAHCTGVGKALLAFLPERELEELVRQRGLRAFTPNTITTLVELKQELALIRQRGYSIDNEEFEEGLKCIGAPVRDYSGRVVASVSIAGPAFRLTDKRIPILARSVMAAARAISRDLGYRGAEEDEGGEAERSRRGAVTPKRKNSR